MSRLVLLVAAVALGAGALILVFTSNDGPEPLAAEARGAAGDAVALAEEPEFETAPSDQARSEADRVPSSRVDESPVREAADRLRVEVRLDGAPLASAEVRAIAWSTDRAALADREAGLPPSVVEAALSAQTDDDGVVVLPLATLRADAVFLAARGPGSGPGGLVVPLPADRATVDVPREQVMSGGIWTWPDPVLLPGATVFARRAFRAEAEVRDAFDPVLRVAGMFFHGEAVTDEGGIYRLGGLPESRIFLQASAPGRSPSRRVDVFLPSAEPVTASLLAGGLSLSGTVVDAESAEPLEGVTVMAISKPPGGPQWEGEHAVTRVDGAFALTAPIDGTNEIGVSAWLDGYEPAHVLFAQEPRDDLAVRLTRRPEFRVLLRDEAGEPVTGVADVTLLDRVTLLRLDFGRADAEGIARFHVDPSRPLMVLVSAEGYDPAQEMDVRAEEGDHEIVLQRRATVTGTVRGEDGAPIAARVRLRRE